MSNAGVKPMNDKDAGVRRVAWCITMPIKGGGGFRTIFENAKALQRAGYACDFYLAAQEGISTTAEKLRAKLCEWFGITSDGVYVLASKLQVECSLVIATSWETVQLAKLLDCPHKAYFVQDYEPWFLPMGDRWIVAEQTYRQGFGIITIGRWLANRCAELSGSPCFHTDFGTDHKTYRPSAGARERAVCAIYQPEKDRRAPELLLHALELVHAADPSVGVYLYGSDEQPQVPDGIQSMGLLATDECNELYGRCSCGVSMGLTNPSRIPFEMMTSGLPIVDIYGENNRYDLPESSVLLASPDAASMAEAILRVVDDAELARSMSEAGVSYMARRTAESESAQFVAACDAIAQGIAPQTEPEGFPLVYHAAAVAPRDELLTAARLQEREIYEDRLRESLPLSSPTSWLDVAVHWKGQDAPRELVLPTWMAKDQSDIVWYALKQDGASGDAVWRCKVRIPPTGSTPQLLCLHLYGRFGDSDELKFLLDASRMVISAENVPAASDLGFPEKEIETQSLTISLSAGEAPQAPAAAKPTTPEPAAASKAEKHAAAPEGKRLPSPLSGIFGLRFGGR